MAGKAAPKPKKAPAKRKPAAKAKPKRKAPAKKKAPTKRGVGKPTKYRAEWPDKAREMAKQGLVDKDIAYNFGIHATTMVRLKREHPELEQAINEGRRVANQKVESALFKRAVGFQAEEVTTKIIKLQDDDGNEVQREVEVTKKTKQVAPDTGACMCWLKNRDPQNWRDRHDVNLSTETPLQVEDVTNIEDAQRAYRELIESTKES